MKKRRKEIRTEELKMKRKDFREEKWKRSETMSMKNATQSYHPIEEEYEE